MNETQVWALGFLAGLLLVAAVMFIRNLKNGKADPQFDERQMAARNQAYKHAFFSLLLYCAVCAVLDALEIKWATLTAILFIGIFGSVLLFAVICIIKDAYEGLNQRRSSSLLIFSVVGAVNLAVFIVNVADGESLLTDGLLNERILNPCMAVMFFALAAVWFFKSRTEAKAGESE